MKIEVGKTYKFQVGVHSCGLNKCGNGMFSGKIIHNGSSIIFIDVDIPSMDMTHIENEFKKVNGIFTISCMVTRIIFSHGSVFSVELFGVNGKFL
jgi:hypothetical protein